MGGASSRPAGYSAAGRAGPAIGAPADVGRGAPPSVSVVQLQTARAGCPFCSVENEYSATPGGGPVALRCGACARQFQAMLPPVAGARGDELRGMSLCICRRCGSMNQYPTPSPGASPPSVQCGACGSVSQTTHRPRRTAAEMRLAEHMLFGTGGGNVGPLVRINVGGQRRVLPLALLLELMAEERGNSASASDIAALPTRKLEGTDHLGEQTKCLICLDDFGDGDDVKTLPCLHMYHQRCVERWLHTDNSCPVCKTPIGRGIGFAPP